MSIRELNVSVVLLSATLAACTADDNASPDAGAAEPADAAVMQGPLEVIGKWESSFGGFEVISQSQWGAAAVVSYDNDANFAITQNSAAAEFEPSKFNKIVWTEIADKAFYVCWVDYGLDSAEEAQDTSKTADDSDPGNSGCGEFAWTRLFEPLEISGRWATNFASTDEIASASWGAATVVKYNNETNWLVSQNPADDEFGPSKFNRIVWTEPTDGSFYYCWVAYGLDTADAAENSSNTADASDPANSGCGDFAWTYVVPAIEIHGTWSSNFGGTETIDSFTWGSALVTSYDNDQNVAVTQNPEDAEFSPGKFNKIAWTEIAQDAFYYCWVALNLDTAQDAMDSENTANDSDPENAGCGDFPWTKLSAP